MPEQDAYRKERGQFANKLLESNDNPESLQKRTTEIVTRLKDETRYEHATAEEKPQAERTSSDVILYNASDARDKYLADGLQLVADAKPQDTISYITRLDDELSQQALKYEALRDKYLKEFDPEGVHADDPYFLRNAILTQTSLNITAEERADFIGRTEALNQLAHIVSDEKEALIHKVGGTKPNVAVPIEEYKTEAIDLAMESVRQTATPSKPITRDEGRENLLKALEEFQTDKLPPSKGNGPRSTPAVERDTAPERGGR